MIIVPAVAESEQGDPPEIGGTIAGDKRARTPNVGGGIDEKRGVKAENRAAENAPEKKGPATDSEEKGSQDQCGNEVIFCNPDVELILLKVGNVAVERFGVLPQG